MPQSLAQMIRAKYPGSYDDLSDQDLDTKWRAKYPGAYDDIPKSVPNQVTANPDDFTEKPPPQTFGRFVGSAVKAMLPSTTLSDYIEGPAYAAQHPIDSAKVTLQAIKDGSADEWSRAKESAGRVMTSPAMGDKVLALSETIGHLGGTVPVYGTAAAKAGEQAATGDWAGGFGAGLGQVTGQFTGEANKAVRPALARVLGSGNATRMEQALGATTNENKVRSARVAPEMVKRGIWNKDLPTLEKRAEVESSKAGVDVQAAVAKVANKETDVMPLVDALEKTKASAVDINAAGQRVVIEPAQVKAIQGLQDTLMEYGDKISIGSLNKVRLKWDDVVQRGKGFTNPDVDWKVWAAREGRTVLRDELGAASSSGDVDRAMAEYSFWQNIEDVSEATNKRRVGQGAGGGLINSIASGAGTIVGEMVVPGAGTATKIGSAVIGGKIAGSLKRLVSSPGWKMFTAVQRQRVADYFASGNTAAIDDAFRAANGTTRLVGQTQPQSQPQAGRISIVGVNQPQQQADDQEARR